MRIKNWGWAALGSIALHISVLALLWPHTPLQQVSTQGTLIEVRLLTAPTVTVTPASNARPLPPPLKASRHHTIATSATAEPEKVPSPPFSNLAGYLAIDAVDQAAVPQGDWAIDSDILPRGYTLRLVLKLWISAGGTIDHWEITDDGGNPALAAQALSTLDRTPIQPAQLHHIPVPSYRQLEVVLTRE